MGCKTSRIRDNGRMEPIIEYLKRKLREAGPALWEPIATEAGVSKALPRKIVYGDRDNPGVQTIQPLIDFFSAVERGERGFSGATTKARGCPMPAPGNAKLGG